MNTVNPYFCVNSNILAMGNLKLLKYTTFWQLNIQINVLLVFTYAWECTRVKIFN